MSEPWARGHQDAASCLSCSGKAQIKPPQSCQEPRHQAYYDRRRTRNNAYRRERRAEARANGTVYRKGRGKDETRRERQRQEHERLRSIVFDRLGGAVCIECRFSDVRALAFDHKAGGGGAHRRSLSGGAMGYLRALVALPVDELRRLFQVLCANCNMIKRIENGEHYAPASAA